MNQPPETGGHGALAEAGNHPAGDEDEPGGMAPVQGLL
jgi:hypothetical protein